MKAERRRETTGGKEQQRRLPLHHSCVFVLALLCLSVVPSNAMQRLARVAVLDLGVTEMAQRVADELAFSLTKTDSLSLVNRAQARAAARGVGYTGSLNLTLAEARDLGAAIGCDFFITGEAQTLRRTSSARPVYFESYASLFFVSARTGKLILWDQPDAEAATPEEAERILSEQLRARFDRYVEALHKAQRDERQEKLAALERDGDAIIIEEAPEEDSPAAASFRPPHPFRRLRPAYTAAAARVEAEATVDVLVEIDAEGEVQNIEVIRWAGYGLNESVAEIVRRMHFRPAMRDGAPVPVRFLLRYNFRRPVKQTG
ncbi:hypothetical protein BH18ACI2_BH18ACI2_14740 [soil metagenome]